MTALPVDSRYTPVRTPLRLLPRSDPVRCTSRIEDRSRSRPGHGAQIADSEKQPSPLPSYPPAFLPPTIIAGGLDQQHQPVDLLAHVGRPRPHEKFRDSPNSKWSIDCSPGRPAPRATVATAAARTGHSPPTRSELDVGHLLPCRPAPLRPAADLSPPSACLSNLASTNTTVRAPRNTPSWTVRFAATRLCAGSNSRDPFPSIVPPATNDHRLFSFS